MSEKKIRVPLVHPSIQPGEVRITKAYIIFHPKDGKTYVEIGCQKRTIKQWRRRLLLPRLLGPLGTVMLAEAMGTRARDVRALLRHAPHLMALAKSMEKNRGGEVHRFDLMKAGSVATGTSPYVETKSREDRLQEEVKELSRKLDGLDSELGLRIGELNSAREKIVQAMQQSDRIASGRSDQGWGGWR